MRRPLRAWVVECSTGADLYAVAIVLLEYSESLGKRIPVQVFGTDSDPEHLRAARAAVYSLGEMAGVSGNRRKRFFVNEGGSLRVAEDVRQVCRLGRHDWVREVPFSKMDLVFCRRGLEQVLPEGRRAALAKLGFALTPSGVLVTGSAQAADPAPEWAEVVDREHGILKRKPDLNTYALLSAQSLPPTWWPEPLRPRTVAGGARPALAAADDHPEEATAKLEVAYAELESANEELRTANEELQIMKEELSASNAKLALANEELTATNIELTSARDDLKNVLTSLNAPVVVLDARLRVRWFTPAASRFVPLTRADVGRPLLDLQLDFAGPALADMLQSVMHLGKSVQREMQDAGGVWHLVSVLPYLEESGRISGAVLHLLDLRDVKRRLAAEARFRQFFDTAGDAMLLADADKEVLADLNPAAEQLFGYRRAEAVGRGLAELEPLKRIPRLGDVLEEIRRGRHIGVIAVRMPTDEGGTRYLEITAHGFREEDRRLVQFSIRNVTRRKEFERKLQETQKLESLGLLAGGIAHDFNNLLTAILGNASLLAANPGLNPNDRSRAEAVTQAAEQAALLTRQMLAYAGRGRNLVQPVDLGKTIRETAALIRSSGSRNVTVELDLAPDLPPVEADPGQMQQLVMNLMFNAAESIENDPGTVRVRTGVTELPKSAKYLGAGVMEAGRYVSIEVTDNGAGMDSHTLLHMFDPFFTTKFAGRGLGLAAAQGIINAHGGDMRVWSAPGKGSTFLVLLPPGGRTAAAAEVPRALRPAPRGSTVLVIDDEPAVRDVTSAILESNGMRVLAAESGGDGVELLRRHGREISLIILDFAMPGMSGAETLPLLRQIRPDVPVLLSSGYDQSEAAERFGDRQVTGIIQKPDDVDRLLEAVSTALSTRV